MSNHERSNVKPTCVHCTAEVSNGLALCGRCQQTLTIALVNTAAFHADVLRIQPGQRVKVRSTFQSAAPAGLTKAAYDPISAATDAVDNMLATWCRVLVDDRQNVGAPPASAGRQCAWLEQHVRTIATLSWAAELLRDALSAERKLQRILDRADTGWYAGKCGTVLEDERVHNETTCLCACHQGKECDIEGGCGAEVVMIAPVVCERGLYATPGHGWIRCPECGTTHDSGSRREQMMAEARDELAPVSAIARIVVGLVDAEQSVERMTNRIDQWVTRGQLHDFGVRVLDGRPRRVYRLGDVFDLVNRNVQRDEPDAC